MGESSRKGVMYATCIRPILKALSVCLYIQSDKPKPVMLEASTEMIWPSQTMVNPNIPEGRLGAEVGELFNFSYRCKESLR